jgi:hypothetical protein
VIEVEWIAADVVLCRHLLQRGDLTVDAREAARRWDELQPALEEVCPALALERRVRVVTDEPKEDSRRRSVPRRRGTNANLAQRAEPAALVRVLVVLVTEARLEPLGDSREVVGEGEPDPFARERLRERATVRIPSQVCVTTTRPSASDVSA